MCTVEIQRDLFPKNKAFKKVNKISSILIIKRLFCKVQLVHNDFPFTSQLFLDRTQTIGTHILASRPDNITPHTDIMINNLTATQRAMLSPPRLPA
ncbi:MAG: hypothetical protein DI538_30385 [Azospira oryzae]|nr:MAG: hypothetical protein DI538_30385 [Azospira oryzae]